MEDVTGEDGHPGITPTNPAQERGVRWVSGTAPGNALGSLLARTIARPQLRPLVSGEIPWQPLRRPVAEARVAIVTTAGVHLSLDPPFRMSSDASFRVIPGTAQAEDLTITHQAYDRTDALQDVNLVFPLQRLRELQAEGVIGQVADQHFGFGLSKSATALLGPGREAARRLARSQVNLALLVPA